MSINQLIRVNLQNISLNLLQTKKYLNIVPQTLLESILLKVTYKTTKEITQ